jgi:outer membrane autotransporter protein
VTKHRLLLTTGLISIVGAFPTLASADPLVTATGAVSPTTAPVPAWNVSGQLTVGDGGAGEVSVESGGTLTTGSALVGSIPGESGRITVTGAGSSWVNQNIINFSRYGGSGSIVISDGATFQTYDGSINMGAGAVLEITGPGTTVDFGTRTVEPPVTWSNAAGYLSANEGTVILSDGAHLKDDGGYLGGAGSTWAEMTVTGAGTLWENELNIYVGGNGNGNVGYGRLLIADGAVATAYTGAVGTDTGSFGETTLTGTGTRLEVLSRPGFAGNFRVGFNGNGKVAVQNGATLIVANQLDIATNAGSSGVLAIGAQEGAAAVAPGIISADNGIYFGEGDATLVFNHTSDDYGFDQTLLGTGGAIRHLAGTTTYTGDGSGFDGSTSVLGGTLVVNGILAGIMEVGAGGSLRGTGTIGTLTAEDGAVIAPGNSIGTLSVGGDFVQEAGSIYAVELDPSSKTSDLIAVAGTAAIEEGALLSWSADGKGPFTPNRRYTIVTAGEGLTGGYTWSGSNAVSAFYDLVASYDATAAYLTVSQTTSFAEAAKTRNQKAVGHGLESLSEDNAMRSAVGMLPSFAEAREAFDQLSGEVYASGRTVLLDESRFTREATSGQLVESGKADGIALWSQGYGAWGAYDGDGNAVGFSRDAGGVFVGADGEVVKGFRLGIVGGYGTSSTDLDDGFGSLDASSYSLGLYGGGAWEGFRLGLGLATAWHDLSTQRSVAFSGFSDDLSADYDAQTTQAYGDLGYDIDVGSATFTPFAGLAYVSLDTADFKEKGGDAALKVEGDVTAATLSTLGLRASSTFEAGGVALTLDGMLGWQHSFDEVTPTSSARFAGSDSFTVAGVPLARDLAIVEAGMSAAVSEALSLGISYSGRFGDGVEDQGVDANLRVKF